MVGLLWCWAAVILHELRIVRFFWCYQSTKFATNSTNFFMGKRFREDLMFPDLSYKIVGACFETFNEIGSEQKEKHYQKGISLCLNGSGLKFKEQVHFPIICHGKRIGDQFLDFLIEDCVVLEIKVGDKFKPQDFQQVKAYLIKSGKPLGILVRFGKDGVTFCRILRPNDYDLANNKSVSSDIKKSNL